MASSDEDKLANTKNDGTPDLQSEVENSLDFQKIILNPGDIVLFSSTCPHRSSRNNSDIDRRTIYYTYSPKKFGDNYSSYFFDKHGSQNKTSKSLSGEI